MAKFFGEFLAVGRSMIHSDRNTPTTKSLINEHMNAQQQKFMKFPETSVSVRIA